MATMFNERQQGNLPSTSKVNSRRDGKEHCKAVTLRSGKWKNQSKPIMKRNQRIMLKILQKI